MTDQWHDDSITSAQVKDDDDDAPDDWEAELEEKPKSSDVEEKSKVPVKTTSTTKNKVNKKKFTNEEDSQKIVDGNSTSEPIDEIQKKDESHNMVSELTDKNGERQSLNNLNLITRDEFLNYSLRLSNHLDIVSKSEFYPDFIEHFLNGITKSMPTDDIKRLSATLQVITLRKQSEEREKKAKSKTKKQAKPQLKPIRRTDYGNDGNGDFDEDIDYDDDDFE